MAQARTIDAARLAIPIAIIFFAWGFGTGALWVARPLFAASFGVSLTLIGLVSSLSAGPRMISGPLTGFLADRWGRRPMIFAGAIGHGGILVLQFFSANYWQYALLEVAAGLGIAVWTVSSNVLVADLTNVGNRGRGVALRNTAQHIGMLEGLLSAVLLRRGSGCGGCSSSSPPRRLSLSWSLCSSFLKRNLPERLLRRPNLPPRAAGKR